MDSRVVILQVCTTVDLELVKSGIIALVKAMNRPCKWVQEHRLQSFVIQTAETPVELRLRLSELLMDTPGFGACYCFTAPDDLVGNHGEWEGLRFHIDKARIEVGKWNETQDVRRAQRRKPTFIR